jgi:O-succinylbenzoate synthase
MLFDCLLLGVFIPGPGFHEETFDQLRLFALKIANRYQKAKSRHLFRDFVDAAANIAITKNEILDKFQKRATICFPSQRASMKLTL